MLLNASDTSIIVKEANKGGTIVIVDVVDGKQEVYCQLYNVEFYRMLPNYPSVKFLHLIKMVVNDAVLMDIINKTMGKILFRNMHAYQYFIFYITLRKQDTHLLTIP